MVLEAIQLPEDVEHLYFLMPPGMHLGKESSYTKVDVVVESVDQKPVDLISERGEGDHDGDDGGDDDDASVDLNHYLEQAHSNLLHVL